MQDQPLLPITEIFTNASYERFLSTYNLSTAEVAALLSNEKVLQIFSYLSTLAANEHQFFELIELLNAAYPIKNRTSSADKVMNLLNKALVDTSSSTTSHQATAGMLKISANTTRPSLNQRIRLTLQTRTSYRGWVNFSLQYKSSANDTRGNINNSTYFTASNYLHNGVQFMSQDNGEIILSSFIEFHKKGYYRLLARDDDRNEVTLSFTVDMDTNIFENKEVMSEYIYTATNCKRYTVQRLRNDTFTSPNFQYPMYFIAASYLERYVDSKNPGTCQIRTTYATNEFIRNVSDTQHIAPNGKIYFIERDGNSYYSLQTESKRTFPTINALRQMLTATNPLANFRPHTHIQSEETYTAKIAYTKEVKIYKTDKGWMSYALPIGTYFSTAKELKNYLNTHLK
ncbi:MAG: hypothetical protein LBP53_00820 [Candidatus Peribacteria bacterium]|nr:hypothetical protein [Candidatus Peribacteria bacterium]